MTSIETGPTTPLDFARRYIGQGWRVIPIPPRSKHPAMPAWQNEGSTDLARIEHWWNEQPDWGVGIVTGLASGLVVIDIDESDAVSGFDMLADLEAMHERLPETLTVLTGGGGEHRYFRYTGPAPITNDAGRLLGPGLDVRGEGGQVVAPPSLHASGRRYEFDEGSGWPSIVKVATLPDWLADLLIRPARPDRPVERRTGNVGHRAGDKWMAQTSWHDLLVADGATYLGERVDRVSGQPYQLWSRPAMADEQHFTPHISATANYREMDVLKVFTPNWCGYEAGQLVWRLVEGETYTKLGYLTATRFGGDFQAAVASLEAAGFTAERDPDDDASKLAPPTPVSSEWDDPVPVSDERPLPSFPLDVFPAWMSDRIAEVVDELSTPVDLPGLLGLGALATLAHGRVKVHVAGEWIEHVNLYLLLAAPSGVGKSPAMRAMFAPVYALEAALREEAKPGVAQAQGRVAMLEAQHRRAVQAKEPQPELIDKLSVDLMLARSAQTTLPKLTAGDVTPEALVQRMAQNEGRMAVVSSEGGPLAMAFGRYSDRPAVEVYLQGYSGDTIEVGRIGREDVAVPEAVLTIVACVQPDMLVELGGNMMLRRRGYTPRFTYAVLPDQAGVNRLVEPREPSDVRRLYEQQMTTLGRWVRRYDVMRPLRFDSDAVEAFNAWRVATDRGEIDRSIMAKLVVSVARTAGLLALAHRMDRADRVQLDDVRRALRFGDYWVAHVARLEALWSLSPIVEDARHVLTWLASRSDRPEEITLREIHRANQKRFTRSEQAREACLLLVEHGWLRVRSGSLHRRGDNVTLAVHPDVSPQSPCHTGLIQLTVTPVTPSLEDLQEPSSSSSSSIGQGDSAVTERSGVTTPAWSDDDLPANSIFRRRPSDE